MLLLLLRSSRSVASAGLLRNFVFMNRWIFRQGREVEFIVLNLIIIVYIHVDIMVGVIRPASIIVIITIVSIIVRSVVVI